MWRIATIGVMFWAMLPALAQGVSEARAEAEAAPSVRGGVATAGKAELGIEVRIAGMQLQLGGALAAVEPAVRARLGSLAGEPARPALSAATASDQGPNETGSLLSYALSPRVSLGLRYRFLTGEDLAHLEIAESGSLGRDYANHRFVVRARWAF